MTRVLALVGALAAITQAQAPNTLSSEEAGAGFQLLFDGTLESFRANFVEYQMNNPNTSTLSTDWQLSREQQAIVTKKATMDIRSKLQYGDFDLRMDYMNEANQGIIYRFNLLYGRGFESGIEYSIENRTEENARCLECPGAAYHLYAPIPNPYRPFSTGQWNQARIVVIKDSVEHWMNGVKVVGFRYHSADFWTRFNISKWNAANQLTMKVPGDRNGGYIESGYIGFQGMKGGNWYIRNLRITTKNLAFGPTKTVSNSLNPVLPKTRAIAFLRSRPGLTGFLSASDPAGSDFHRRMDGRAIHPPGTQARRIP